MDHGILQTRILEWGAYPFSRGSSRGSPQPRDGSQVSRIAGRFFASWATREAPIGVYVTDKIKAVSLYSFRELRDSYSCDLSRSLFYSPACCLEIKSPPENSSYPIRCRLKALCLKASTGKLEKVVTGFRMRRNSVCRAFWRRAALRVGAPVKFCVTHTTHYMFPAVTYLIWRKCSWCCVYSYHPLSWSKIPVLQAIWSGTHQLGRSLCLENLSQNEFLKTNY